MGAEMTAQTKVVPIEPTDEMVAAAWDIHPCGATDKLTRAYRAMLAAAPACAAEPVAEVTYFNWNGMNVCILAGAPEMPVGTKLYIAAPDFQAGLEAAANKCKELAYHEKRHNPNDKEAFDKFIALRGAESAIRALAARKGG